MTIHVNMYEYLCNHVTKLHGVDGVHPGVDALHGFLPPDRAATCNLLHAACCRHAAGCMQPACRLLTMTRRRLQAAARCMQAACSLHNATPALDVVEHLLRGVMAQWVLQNTGNVVECQLKLRKL
jgi:hypothetical protein